MFTPSRFNAPSQEIETSLTSPLPGCKIEQSCFPRSKYYSEIYGEFFGSLLPLEPTSMTTVEHRRDKDMVPILVEIELKVKEIKGQLGKKKESAREKMIGQTIGYRYDVNLLPDYKRLTPFLKKYIEAMGWDDLNWLEDVHMGYEEDRPAVFDRNANGWVTIPKKIKLPNNQQDRDMIARELLVKFQMSPNHPLVDLKKAYRKF